MGAKKTQKILEVVEELEKIYGVKKTPSDKIPLIDALILDVIQQKETAKAMKQIYEHLKAEFVDWNEIRVTHTREIEEVLEKHLKHDIAEKSIALRDILVQVFTLWNKMDLEFLLTKELVEVQKAIQQLELPTQVFLLHVLYLNCLNNEVSLSPGCVRVGKRIGLWDDITATALKKQLQKSLDKTLFVRLHIMLFVHSDQVCFPSGYDCSSCSAVKFCGWGKKRMEKQAGSKNRTTKRKAKKEPEKKKKEEPQTRRQKTTSTKK